MSRSRDPQHLGEAPPRQFFMSLGDLSFWIQSARADSELARLEKTHSTQEAFDIVYEKYGDPWGYLVPKYRYQHLKYLKMMAMLPNTRFTSMLDVGCGIGVFARMLAPHVDSGIGIELSSAAVQHAKHLTDAHPHIEFHQADIFQMEQWDEARFDLIVLADILYYLSPLTDEALERILILVKRLLKPQGTVLLANHFFFDVDPQSRMVRRIHVAFRDTKGLTLQKEERHPFFLSTVLKAD